jgi:hypothetical protein
MDNISKLHGMPKSITINRDPTFTGNFYQELFQLQGTQLNLNTAYHFQTDGQTRLVNKCLESYLRYFSLKQKTQWVQQLPLTKWWYSTTYHRVTKMIPLENILGKKWA